MDLHGFNLFNNGCFAPNFYEMINMQF